MTNALRSPAETLNLTPEGISGSSKLPMVDPVCDLLQGQEPYQATPCMAITIPMIAMDMAPMSLESWEASTLVLLKT